MGLDRHHPRRHPHGRPHVTPADVRPWAEPELEALLDTAMSLDPTERATDGVLAELRASTRT